MFPKLQCEEEGVVQSVSDSSNTHNFIFHIMCGGKSRSNQLGSVGRLNFHPVQNPRWRDLALWIGLAISERLWCWLDRHHPLFPPCPWNPRSKSSLLVFHQTLKELHLSHDGNKYFWFWFRAWGDFLPVLGRLLMTITLIKWREIGLSVQNERSQCRKTVQKKLSSIRGSYKEKWER